ncbi:MAG: hypothetical protein ACRDMX_04300 [Solirubrobacteraceae bacterium]
MALVVFIVLELVHPSTGAVVGLIIVLLLWATLLVSSLPSMSGGLRDQSMKATDFGAEADAERERRERLAE